MLHEILFKAGVEPVRISGDAKVGHLRIDSREVQPEDLYVAMPGTHTDSHGYLADAFARGARSAIVHSSAGFDQAVQLGLVAVELLPESFRDAMWALAKAATSNPTAQLKVLGVTGTNGKTTTAWLMADMLRFLGVPCAYIGTLGFHLPGDERELNNTTPFAIELFNLLAEARDKGMQAASMEVSSHALAERRSDGVEFDAAVFTNLTQDHLDYHGTMEAYEAAKFRLFSELPAHGNKPFQAAINVGTEVGRRWASALSVPVLGFSVGEDADLRVDPIEVFVDRLTLRFSYQGNVVESCPRLGGQYNVENCASATAGLLATGVSLEDAAKALESARPVPGRFEAVPNEAKIGILVDYAHTHDALEKLLEAVRPLTSGSVITVFGCGGDRDRTKRPKMAHVASSRSDLTVVTSDNPRTEDPELILRDVEAGIVPGSRSVSICDRPEAVKYAIRQAKPGDIVVIAGKGHENYQVLGRTKHPMDDRKLAQEALATL